MTTPAKSLSIPWSSVLSGFRWALHSSRWFITWPASSWGMSCKKHVRQREYYLNKFWDVRYPKSTECFKLTLKVLMNFGVCVYVFVVLDMDVISLDINWKRWKLYKLLKSAKFVYCMYHHLAQENGNRNARAKPNNCGRTTAPKERHKGKNEHLFFNLALRSLCEKE